MSDPASKARFHVCYSCYNSPITKWGDIDHDFSFKAPGEEKIVQRNNGEVTDTEMFGWRYKIAGESVKRKFDRVTLRDYMDIKLTHCHLGVWVNAALERNAKLFAKDGTADISLQWENGENMNFRDTNNDGLPDFVNVNLDPQGVELIRLEGVDFQPFITSLYEFVKGHLANN